MITFLLIIIAIELGFIIYYLEKPYHVFLSEHFEKIETKLGEIRHVLYNGKTDKELEILHKREREAVEKRAEENLKILKKNK